MSGFDLLEDDEGAPFPPLVQDVLEAMKIVAELSITRPTEIVQEFYWVCHHCQGDLGNAGAGGTPDHSLHAEDCRWVRARRLMGMDLLP